MDEQKKYIDAEEAISEIKQWYWSANIQSIKDDPCVVDAMIDMFIRTIMEQKCADVQPVKRGRWNYKKKLRGGFNRVTGVDDDGNTVTITVDNRREIDEPYCSECGKWNDGSNMDYCGVCGAYML